MSENQPAPAGDDYVRLLAEYQRAESEFRAAQNAADAALIRARAASAALDAARVAADMARDCERVTAYCIADRRRIRQMIVVQRTPTWMEVRPVGVLYVRWQFWRKGYRWVGNHWALTSESVAALPPVAAS